MSIKNIYIFSGLGGDERVFQRLDFSEFSTTFIKWKNPQESETIENYASRLLEQITTPRPILIGLSLGGIMAIEIAKQIDTEQVIIIASAKTKNEIPFYYRWDGKLNLQNFIPIEFLKKSNVISDSVLGKTSSSEKQLLKSIFAETDPAFLKWAICKVFCWSNQTKLKNIKHIHGTKDHIFPCLFVRCDLKIKNGGHFLTLKKADEISQNLKDIISSTK